MFLQRMRNSLLLVAAVLMLVSCSEYQKVLKSKDTGKKYTMAEELYNKAQQDSSKTEYRKALRLLDQIVPQYRGKPQGEKLSFLYADTYYHLGDHYLAGYQFEKFTQTYAKSEKLEEATFKEAKSYYFLSPRYDLDQSQTDKAIAELQKYIDQFPNGAHAEEVNALVKDLQVKLEKKAFEIAKQYYVTGEAGIPGQNYKAAIVAFNNFILEYPGSPFREAAFYYRFASAYQLAINSYKVLMKDRLNTAKGYYDNYIKYYPEGSEYYNQLQTEFQDLDSRLKNF